MDTNPNDGKPNPHAGHRQRLKERFLVEGLENFSDHQVLELLLFYGIPYKDTNGIAHALLERCGTLSGVFDTEYGELAAVPGVGPHAAALLKMTPALARRYTLDRWKAKPQIQSVKDAGRYAASLFIGKNVEEFYMVCLDNQHHVLKAALICEGTINEAMVYPRAIVEHALRHRAAAVIFAHNHPGGSTTPSAADIEITGKLRAALEVISVQVLDHIIVAGEKYASLASDNYI